VLSSACDPQYGNPYSYYPMYYDSGNDRITVWGDDGTGTDCGQLGTGDCWNTGPYYGYTSSAPITFEMIYDFGVAVRGSCAVQSPASGSYAVLSELYIGDGTATTYVATTGESIDFAKQIRVQNNAYLKSGLLSGGGEPYAGSTLSCSGESTQGVSNQGEFYLASGSSFEFDSIT